jgi:hypothetical protein
MHKKGVGSSFRVNGVRFPLLLRVVGVAAMLLAVMGILSGGFTAFIVMTVDFKQVSEQAFAERLPEKLRRSAEGAKFELLRIRKIISAPEFKLFFYSMALFGLAFNGVLLSIGYSLTRIRAHGIWLFIALMVLFAVYVNGLPRIIDTGSPDAQIHFAAAWGAANVGLAPVLLSYFWIWGPVLALIARGRIF